jgi:hypothetical protein
MLQGKGQSLLDRRRVVGDLAGPHAVQLEDANPSVPQLLPGFGALALVTARAGVVVADVVIAIDHVPIST